MYKKHIFLKFMQQSFWMASFCSWEKIADILDDR